MSELVATRVVEIETGAWIVQFAGGLNRWVQLGNETFATAAEARAFEQEQVDSADFGDQE